MVSRALGRSEVLSGRSEDAHIVAFAQIGSLRAGAVNGRPDAGGIVGCVWEAPMLSEVELRVRVLLRPAGQAHCEHDVESLSAALLELDTAAAAVNATSRSTTTAQPPTRPYSERLLPSAWGDR